MDFPASVAVQGGILVFDIAVGNRWTVSAQEFASVPKWTLRSLGYTGSNYYLTCSPSDRAAPGTTVPFDRGRGSMP